MSRILCIPDLQAPFHHRKALDFLRRLRRDVKPTRVMCLGDELDQYTFSKYRSDPAGKSPGDEYDEAMDFWRELFALFPVALSVHSNHVERIFKLATDAGIPRQYLKSVRQFMQAPSGWRWDDEWIVEGIQFEHGERATGQAGLRNLVIANQRSTVIGHRHEDPGTIWVSNGKVTHWGMNVGCLVDPDGLGLRYSKKNLRRPVLGTGVIIDGAPRFVELS